MRSTWRQLPHLAVPALYAGVSAGLTWYATVKWGQGVSQDSANYLAAATHLSRGEGYLATYGTHLVQFPPLYPASMAVLQLLLGVPAWRAAQLSGGLMGAATVTLTWILATRLRVAPVMRAACLALIAISPVLIRIYAYAWSDSLFIVLSLAALIQTISVIHSREKAQLENRNVNSQWVRIALLSATCAAAALTRIVGLALCAGVALVLFRPPRRDPSSRTSNREALSVLVIGSIPLVGWDALNYGVTRTWTFGPRQSGRPGFLDGTEQIVRAALSLLFPASAASIGWVIGTGAVALLLAVVVSGLAIQPRSVVPTTGARVLVIFGAGYLLFLTVARGLGAISSIEDRYLAPILPVLAVLVGVVLSNGFRISRRLAPAAMVRSILALLGLALITTAWGAAARQLVTAYHAVGLPGATSEAWRRSQLVHLACQKAQPGVLLFSNQPELLSFSCNASFNYPPTRDATQAYVQGFAAPIEHGSGAAVLVWVDSDEDPNLLGPNQLPPPIRATLLQQAPEGKIFALSAPGA